MDWQKTSFVCLDINGTGPNHFEKEGIIEIGALKIKDGEVASEVFFKRLNPEIEIPDFISRVHGLYNKDVQDKPKFKEIEEEFFAFLGQSIIICHNCTNEKRLLGKFASNYESMIILDTLNMARSLFKNIQSYSLQSITSQFKIDVPNFSKTNETYTNAMYEARACASVFKYMVNELPESLQNIEHIKKIGQVDTYRRVKNVPLTKFNNS